MRRVFFITILGFLLFLAAPAFATEAAVGEEAEQESASPQQTRTAFDPEHRREIYQANRLQKSRAVLYSLALPGLGNFYAQQPALGTAALMSMVFTTMFIVFGIRNNHPDLVAIGASTGVTTYTVAGATSVLGVNRHNERMRQNLRISATLDAPETPLLGPAPSSWVVGWQVSF